MDDEIEKLLMYLDKLLSWKEINLKPPSIKSKNHILINFCETKFG